jgi:hypothetical protein
MLSGYASTSGVNIAPVRDARYINGPGLIVYLVDHAVVTNADAPFFIAPDELLTPDGLGFDASFSKRETMRALMLFGSENNSFSALVVRAMR